jgi:hypothetical protein
VIKRRGVIKKPVVRLMLDSGAFSARHAGATIDLKEYIKFVKANLEHVDSYFNLDVIPGKPKQRRTPEIIADAARASRNNFLKMRAAGLNPIPVFHQEEDFKWFYRMLDDVADDDDPYIALSTFKELSIPENRVWLDKCFTILTNSGGQPKMRIHGLGIASFDLLRRYPWFSCDATSWALTAAYGSILCPVYRSGKPSWGENPVKLTISDQGKKDGSPLGADHYLRMGPMMKDRVTDFLENHVGVKVSVASKDYEARARAIVFFYLKFQEAIGDPPFKYRLRTLVGV